MTRRDTSSSASRQHYIDTGRYLLPVETERTYRNHYECPRCATTWRDEWSAMCDDDCPHCGCRHISPVHSEDLGIDYPDMTQAIAEGWCIIWSDSRDSWEIQRDDERDVFDSDAAALAHVRARAEADDGGYHRTCLRFVDDQR